MHFLPFYWQKGMELVCIIINLLHNCISLHKRYISISVTVAPQFYNSIIYHNVTRLVQFKRCSALKSEITYTHHIWCSIGKKRIKIWHGRYHWYKYTATPSIDGPNIMHKCCNLAFEIGDKYWYTPGRTSIICIFSIRHSLDAWHSNCMHLKCMAKF